jgi:hypothetical protein
VRSSGTEDDRLSVNATERGSQYSVYTPTPSLTYHLEAIGVSGVGSFNVAVVGSKYGWLPSRFPLEAGTVLSLFLVSEPCLVLFLKLGISWCTVFAHPSIAELRVFLL